MPEEEEVPVNPFLGNKKAEAMARLVSHMDGVGATLYNSYPKAERDSWPIQRPEALHLLSLGETEVLAMSDADMLEHAPFLVGVCQAHYGEVESELDRAQNLWTKAQAVAANATSWAALSAFVNGLRARASDLYDTAISLDDLYEKEALIAGELGAFRNQYGV